MNKKLKIFIFITPILLICTFVLAAGYVSNLQLGIANNLIRLHIVAASDDISDQLAKLCVRDKILTEFSDILKSSGSREESAVKIQSILPKIEECANTELLKLGKTDKVFAKIEKSRFPTKKYGSVTLPAGDYTALNIKIGAADGRNWWCVMYPPLCITDRVVSVPDESMEYLKSKLTDEEYNFITDDNIEIKIKFRLAEILFGIY